MPISSARPLPHRAPASRLGVRRLLLDQVVGSGRRWPTSAAIDDAVTVAGSLGEVVLEAISAKIVRCERGAFTFDRGEFARWYRLVEVDDEGGVTLCIRRALQIAEYVRLRRLVPDPDAVRALDVGLDLAVDLPGGRRWGIVVTEARFDDMRELLRDLRSEGVAILDLASTEGLRPVARTVAVLHDRVFHHFSLVGHGARFDLRVLRREGCVLFERDVPPR